MKVDLKNIKGSIEDMEDLFDNAESLSVRYYCPAEKDRNNFDITIRCNEDVAKVIKKKRSVKSLLKADKEI